MCTYRILTRTIKSFLYLTAFLSLPGTVQIIDPPCMSFREYILNSHPLDPELSMATTKTKPLSFLGLQKFRVTG